MRAGVYAGAANWPGVELAKAQLGYWPTPISDYLDSTAPSYLTSGYPMNQYAANLPAGLHYCFGVPMLWTGYPETTGPYLSAYSPANVIAGDYDSDFNSAFANIAALDPNAIVRLGWEMNGYQMCWSLEYVPAATFITLFQHVATLAHAHGLQVCWNPALVNGYDNDWTVWWPGGSYVDVIGLDMYSMQYEETANPTEPGLWNTYITQGAPFTGNGSGVNFHSLGWCASYAAYQGKPLLFCEFGLWPASPGPFPAEGGTGDDPYWVEQMGLWVSANNAQIVLWTQSTVGILSNGGYGGSVAAPNATAQAIQSFQLPTSVGKVLNLGGGKVLTLGGGKVLYV